MDIRNFWISFYFFLKTIVFFPRCFCVQKKVNSILVKNSVESGSEMLWTLGESERGIYLLQIEMIDADRIQIYLFSFRQKFLT